MGDSQGLILTDQDQNVRESDNFDYPHYGFLTHIAPHTSETLYWKMPERFMGDKVYLIVFFKIWLKFR